MIDTRNGETAHQLFVEDSYFGAERNWEAARDGQGRKLRFITISKNEITCENGCSYAEEFAAALPETLLRASPQGFAVSFTAHSGATKTVTVPGDLVANQLTAVAEARAGLPTAAAAPPPPPATPPPAAVADRSYAVAAPSTGRAAPDTKEASSDRRNSAALAISSGLPVRRSGICWARRWTSASLSSPPACCWSGRATKTRSIGVSIGPGQTALTRILSGARRFASERTKPTTPNFAIE